MIFAFLGTVPVGLSFPDPAVDFVPRLARGLLVAFGFLALYTLAGGWHPALRQNGGGDLARRPLFGILDSKPGDCRLVKGACRAPSNPYCGSGLK